MILKGFYIDMKHKKLFSILLLTILIINSILPSASIQAEAKKTKKNTQTTEVSYKWPKGPSVDADSAILMDLSTGLVLYEKNSHKEQYPASITKIMTTLLAIENCSMGEIVTFSHDAIFGIETGSSHIGIDVGEKLSMEQCLYAIMLASANEVSWGVGEHISGSLSAFADKMNARAKELGCKNTHFVNANGLHDDNHYTSAYDMALISRQAMKYSTFRKITSTKRYTIPPTNKHENENAFLNHHQMLYGYKYPKYEYEYCIGGKTGYTTKAGSTLVTFAEKDGIELVCVVMRANGAASPQNEYTDTTSLFNFGFENYKRYTIHSDTKKLEDSPLFTMYSPFFDANNSPLKIDDSSYVLLPNDVDFEEAKEEITFFEQPLEDGENVIGTISYTFDGKTVGSTDIIYDKQAEPTLTFYSATKEVKEKEVSAPSHFDLKPIIIGIIIAIVAFFVWLYFHFKNKRRRSRQFDLRF